MQCLQSAERLQADLEAQTQAIEALQQDMARIESERAHELQATVARQAAVISHNLQYSSNQQASLLSSSNGTYSEHRSG